MKRDLGLEPYVQLLEAFLQDRITASDFEKTYLRLFKSDDVFRPEEVFGILDALFADVDAFDPEGLTDEGLDEAQLRKRVRSALERLMRLVDGSP